MSAAIVIDDVSKKYRLYHERNQALKAAILRRRRARYEEFWALREVSFEIEKGSTFGLIGENGSGKSTLLKCIANILRPDGGSIAVEGKLSALLELGAGFHPELSGRENIFLNGAILGLSKKQITARFDEIVDFAGLEQFVDSPVKNYSSGMYVRLGFSVAINVDPDILLIDEILAVGDAEFQAKCSKKFAELRASGKTIVIVSHAIESIREFCDHAALLDHGKIRSIGPSSGVINDYLKGVHLKSRSAEDARRGTGEIQIERVVLLDADERRTTRTRTGEAVTLRLMFSASQPIERPVFGFGIARIDGVGVTGPNTQDYDMIPDKVEGHGHVDYHVPSLPLLPGTYDVNASINTIDLTSQYDGRVGALRFDVEPGGTPGERLGLISFRGSWEIADNEQPS
ncbi:MAG: ABC transporter ATP-binding protein [Acidimicrobiia bacterium]